MNYTGIFIAGGFTILGALIAGVVGQRFIVIQMLYNTRWAANTKLQEAFNEELAILQRKTVDEAETCAILERSVIKHQIAVNDFLIHLKEEEAIDFTDAWLRYYGYHEEDAKAEDVFFEKYFHHNDKEGRDNAIKNIQAILSFANPPVVKPWYQFW
ncbi:hypothetical protein NX722_02935 [Endozoicomonas gorgoniicola]|uniref:Uncharacterized protein n=1 Tax=Endozoicomonas gorgoniicola TaxID=1234144 RepID=A0ABT3MQG3_9GAMM|nr:hypothetical protein [Endozoicomonas gorgoniicola]MCW7551615.1 hypothetical protein [Endozoicomonas gorgoniicola]